MARQKTMYKLIGRYVRGNDTIYYALMSDSGKEVKYTEEQMAFLVGRDQVVNVKAQLYQDKVLFRGIGCDIKSLPTISLGGDVEPPIPRPTGPKPVQPKYEQKHILSKDILNEVSYKAAKLGSRKTYEEVIEYLLEKFNNIAYNLEMTMYFRDCETYFKIESVIWLRAIDDNIYYIDVNIWGSQDKCKLAVSKTTFQLIEYEYPKAIVKDFMSDLNKSEYKYCHYHELAIRIGAFSRIPQYKKLKLRFAKYNTEIFEDKIPHDLVMMVGEYKDGTHFDDLEGLGGYSRRKEYSLNSIPLILLKYSAFRSVDNINNLSRNNLCTLLHEMAHAYVDAVYGSNWELDPSCMGDVMYGVDKNKYPEQYRCHGKRFGTAVQMVSDKTGLSFDEIFSYGIRINNTIKDTEYTTKFGHNSIKRSRVSDQAYSNSHYIIKGENGYPDHITWTYRKSFENIKRVLLDKQDNLNKYFVNKFNMRIRFNISEDESRIITVDNMGVEREYDINFEEGKIIYGKPSVLLYRMIDNERSTMLCSEDIKSTPSSVIKRLLENIYMDSTTD